MKRILQTVALLVFVVLGMQAKGWNEQEYRQIEQSIRLPQFSDKVYDITKFGAKPDNPAAKNQKAIQKAIDKCSKKGGGKVVVPAGQKFLTAAIELKSGVNLVIKEGAVLEFAFETELYPIVPTRWEGLDCWNLSPLIYAYQAKDIAITGKGTIDGGGSNETWWPWCGNKRFGMKEGGIAQNQGARARLLKYAEDGVPMDARLFGPKVRSGVLWPFSSYIGTPSSPFFSRRGRASSFEAIIPSFHPNWGAPHQGHHVSFEPLPSIVPLPVTAMSWALNA